MEKSLARNAKIVVPWGSRQVNVIGELAGILPFSPKRRRRSGQAGHEHEVEESQS